MKKSILMVGCLFFFLGAHAHSVTLNQFLKSSNLVKNWDGFKDGNCFHCTNEESQVTIEGKKFEISTFRVVGLEDTDIYKTFGELVQKLKLGDSQSKSRKLYKEFPDLQFELLNVDAKNPKLKILIALRAINPSS